MKNNEGYRNNSSDVVLFLGIIVAFTYIMLDSDGIINEN